MKEDFFGIDCLLNTQKVRTSVSWAKQRVIPSMRKFDHPIRW